MKTLISSSGKNTNARFDLRFARASWFCVYDEESKNVEFIENYFLDSNTGLGNKVVEMVLELGIKKIISGDFGSNVKNLLGTQNIQMVILKDENLSIQDIINKIK